LDRVVVSGHQALGDTTAIPGLSWEFSWWR
jgi:hypothetical protein